MKSTPIPRVNFPITNTKLAQCSDTFFPYKEFCLDEFNKNILYKESLILNHMQIKTLKEILQLEHFLIFLQTLSILFWYLCDL